MYLITIIIKQTDFKSIPCFVACPLLRIV